MIDCVGPLSRTRAGHKYILTMMCAATRFLEAIPLRNISSKKILDALINFFTRVGLPKFIQTDQGSKFMSKIFRQVTRQLGIQHLRSSAYHPVSGNVGAIPGYHQNNDKSLLYQASDRMESGNTICVIRSLRGSSKITGIQSLRNGVWTSRTRTAQIDKEAMGGWPALTKYHDGLCVQNKKNVNWDAQTSPDIPSE